MPKHRWAYRLTLGATMTTYRYDRATRPWPRFLPRMESLRPDRRVPIAKVSISGRSSGVRLSANLINTPEGHGSTVTARSRVRPAILTGGISMLATGLPRKEVSTEAHCNNCRSTWQF